jgi:hypothetical protein
MTIGRRPAGGHHRAPTMPPLDTTEIRWFSPGPLPSYVRDRFPDSTRTIEQRNDIYLLNGRADVGVKIRGGTVLELKVRQGAGCRIHLGGGLTGRLERWRKWSPATGLVDIPASGRWVAVGKIILKRRFSQDGLEEPWTPGQPGSPACVIELVEVRVGSIVAWSLALAASGPPSTRHAALVACSRATMVPAPNGGPVELGAGRSMSYPEWLVRTIDGRSEVPTALGVAGRSGV